MFEMFSYIIQLLCGKQLIEMQKLKYNFLAYISLENEHS